MAPSRKNTNGRSPLVNQQSQITSFFSKPSQSKSQSPLKLKSKSKSKLQSEQNPNSTPSVKSNPNPNPNSSPFVSPITSFSKTSPSQSKLKKKSQSPSQSEQNPNLTPFAKSSPNPNTSPSSSPSASPTTPSPLNGKSKPKTLKPLLIVGLHPSSSYREEAVNRRIRVYWPIDRAWYEGCVKSFDRVSGKHLVEYDDADEELLELSKEKIEFLDGEVKKFRRLRKVSVIDDDNDDDENGIGNESAGGDLSDEDWGINEVNEVADDCSEDLEPEDEEVGSTKKMRGGNGGARKRKVGKGEKADGSKKRKVVTAVGGDGGNTVGIANNGQEAKVIADNVVNVCASERFGSREAEKLPFLGKDRRDAKKRRPGDADYDPRTLYLPPEFLKRLSSGQRQWWEFKSKHMDKVLFFKMGKFYELFEMDAHVGVKELDLQYMKGEQPHCGFPERNFSVNVEKLARKGYRVLVVEQTETPEQLEIRRREEGSKDKVVKREICAVVTKGTLTEGEMLSANPDASYIMSITECCPKSLDKNDVRLYGVCVVDAATSRIIVGQIEDDMECSVLCCLLSELRPAEILKPTKTLSPETERMLTRHTRNPLVNELVPGTEFWDSEKTTRELTSFYSRISDLSQSEQADTDNNAQENSNLLPDVLNQLLSSGANLALSALGSVIFYVRQAFLDETLLKYAKYEFLPCSTLRDVFRKPYMVLDAAALENLEIFENSKNGDLMGTLYSQLNHCVTAFGKRLLKSWLARPLFHEHSIRERQDAIAGLKGKNLSFALEFQRELAKLPDMERLIARLFASSEAIGRNANKIVLYEDASKKQLQEFILALRGCETMVQACSSLRSILDDVDSELLHHLLISGKGLPDISSILEQFRDAFDWNEANNSGRIIPREGVDSEYDSACKKIKDIESNLRKHLKEQQKLLGDRTITYVSVGKEAYLLEIPEKLRSNIPREYELRSSKKGYFRYWTSYIKKMLGELTEAESEKDSKLKSILQTLIRRFCVHHSKWRQLASSVAELDVLISLAIASDYYEGPSCRPIISSVHNPDEAPHLRAKSLGHPILRSDSLGKGTFVPNDITIGGSDCASFLLLTGPNMGGKSTLLRQVCLAVILAQVGADVPAEHFELSLIDRIFVRMGAKDNIMGGQSTFLTELSETASMLTSATRHSLVALDELGRGTATSDGQAIAESVLEYFVRKVQCRGMFSTHYHRLAVDYKRDPKVSLCHMACEVGKGVEGGVEEVTFLYRLNPGACPKSYGVNVARLAGIPDSVLRKAAAKSREFEATCGRRKEASKNGDRGWEEVIAEFIQNLTDVHSGESYQSTSQSRNIDLLNALQHRARILLRQC